MAFKAPVKPKSDPVPAGSHVGKLYQFLHLGTIEGGKFGPKDTIRLTFELPEETKVFKEGEDPKPLVISREFSNSMGPKASLRKFVESMVGVSLTEDEAAGFDLQGLIGENCLLNVVHEKTGENTYANIASVSPLLKNMAKPKAFNEPVFFDINQFDLDTFTALPEFLRKKIESTQEYANLKNKMAMEEGKDPLAIEYEEEDPNPTV